MKSKKDIRICVVGSGYVGLTVGLCLADFGFKVTCADKDAQKIDLLKKGKLPIHEKGLADLLQRTIAKKTIKFSADTKTAVLDNNIIFVAVGTPSQKNGSADTTFVFDVAKLIAENLNEYKIVVLKSTVPVGTNKAVKEFINQSNKEKVSFGVVSNPEFLRQGKALSDFLSPHRIVIGTDDKKAIELLQRIHQDIESPLFVTSPENAEIIKYASNSFLAMKISYINEIANLCERCGADVKDVAKGMGLDPRIGDRFLDSGIGFGGSCFPKDMKALLHTAQRANYDFKLLKSALEINEYQKNLAVFKLKKHLGELSGKAIGLWGLSFKPETDDIREASSIALIASLLEAGAKIKAHDPKAEQNMRQIFPEVAYHDGPYEVAAESDGLVLVTEWADFENLDLKRVKKLLKNPVLIDGRNLYDPAEMKKAGFIYEGIGRL